MEQTNGSYSIGRRWGMELVTCRYIPDLRKWCGYPKDQPHDQAYGESFEELHLKLHNPHRDLSQAAPSSPCYNQPLHCWYWQHNRFGLP
jgi:hypothetical protein